MSDSLCDGTDSPLPDTYFATYRPTPVTACRLGAPGHARANHARRLACVFSLREIDRALTGDWPAIPSRATLSRGDSTLRAGGDTIHGGSAHRSFGGGTGCSVS